MRSTPRLHNCMRTGVALLMVALLVGASHVQAQAASRFLGTITAVGGDTLTVKTDAGEVRQVEVPSSAVLKRIAPGQRDLSAAVDIQFSDLQTGDRVLVRLSADASGSTPQAAQIVTIKAADVAEKEQKDREDWQARGVGGLVKSVNANDGTILVTSGAGTAIKTVTVHVSKTTVLKRYAPGSVRFDLAQPAPMDAIHPGDQLRARGEKSADGNEMQAEEVVSGSFRNISGTIVSVDAANTSLVVKDLLAKKNVTVHIPTDAQMHALPDMMAKMLAARLKGATTGGSPTGQGPAGASTGGNPMAAQQGGPARNGQPGAGRWAGRGQAQSGSMQQMLNRAPVIQFSDLKKGDAVMVVSTQGASEVTAITLLSGVEPLLEAPEASRNLLSNWSMGSGGSADEPAQ